MARRARLILEGIGWSFGIIIKPFKSLVGALRSGVPKRDMSGRGAVWKGKPKLCFGEFFFNVSWLRCISAGSELKNLRRNLDD